MAPIHFDIDNYRSQHPEPWRGLLRRLGDQDAKFIHLSDGASGSAYRLGDRVVKFTTDPTETVAMGALVGLALKYVVRVYAVWRLPMDHSEFGVIWQEHLRPGERTWKDFGELASFYFSQVLIHPFDPMLVDQFDRWAKRRLTTTADEITKVPRIGHRGVRERPPSIEMEYPEHNPDQPFGNMVTHPRLPTTEQLDWLKALSAELQQHGIDFYDLNAGNMMRRDTQHVVIDLGMSAVRATKQRQTELVLSRLLMRAAQVIAALTVPDELSGVPNVWNAVAQRMGHDIKASLQRLGRGTKGNVYGLSDGTALKLTTDPAEVKASQHLLNRTKNKILRHIVKVLDVMTLADGLTAIKLERLRPPAPDWVEFFRTTEAYFLKQLKPVLPDEVLRFITAWRQSAETPDKTPERLSTADEMGDWSDINPGDEIEIRTNVRFPDQLPAPQKFDWLIGLARELEGVGIEFSDMNPGNIMRRPNGDYVVTDLGVSRIIG